MVRTAWLTLLLAALAPAGAQQPADSPTTTTLVISAQDASGLPLANVTFQADVPGSGKATATTNNTGMARLGVPSGTDTDKLTMTLADPRFQMPQNPQRVTPNKKASTQFFIAHLLPADVTAMSPLERSALVESIPALYRSRWAKGEKADSGPLRYAAFLEGFGDEEAPDAEEVRLALATPTAAPTPAPSAPTPTPVPPAPAIAVMVKDRSGAPQANRTVLLFELSDAPGHVRVALSRRTGSNGLALFSPLKAGVAYRAQVPQDAAGLYAPGPIVVLPEPPAKGRPIPHEMAMVLRDRSRSVSGLVYNGNEAARGVRLRTQDPTQPTVETVSDEFGYFELGPLRAGETRLVIEEPYSRRTAEITVALGAGEVLVPLDVLLAPTGQ